MSVLRRHWAILLLLAVLAPPLFAWSWSGQIGILGNDGPAYLMMAAHYQPGLKADPVYTLAAVGSKYPPVYPLALAAMGASELHRAHAATTSFLLLGLLTCYAWLRGERATRTEAVAVVLLFALLPGTWLTALLIQSEFLFLLLSIAALALMSHYRRRGRRESLLAAAIVVALASLTRTIGVTLFLPLLATAWRAPRREALLVMVFSVLPFINWHLFHRATQGYSDELQGAYGGLGLDAVAHQFGRELAALRVGFGENFRPDRSLRSMADLLGLLCLACAAWRLRRGRPDGLYLLASLAVLVVWPYPEEARRFLWVLLPVLLGQALLVLKTLLQPDETRSGGATLVKVTLAAGILGMALPAQSFLLQRSRAAAASPIPEAAHNALWYVPSVADAERWVGMQVVMIATLEQAGSVVPPSDCILATRPDIVNYFARRISTYPPSPSIPDAQFPGQLRSIGCHYLFSIVATDPNRRLAPLYPLGRIPGEFDTVLACAAPDDRYDSPEPVCLLTELKPANGG